jgi:hypothetical protein
MLQSKSIKTPDVQTEHVKRLNTPIRTTRCHACMEYKTFYTPQCKAKCGVSNSKEGWDAEIRWETACNGMVDAWFIMIANHSPRVWRAVGLRHGPGQTQWANNGAWTLGPAPPSSGCCLKHKISYIKDRTNSYHIRNFYALRYRWIVLRNKGWDFLPSVIWQKMNDRFYCRQG